MYVFFKFLISDFFSDKSSQHATQSTNSICLNDNILVAFQKFGIVLCFDYFFLEHEIFKGISLIFFWNECDCMSLTARNILKVEISFVHGRTSYLDLLNLPLDDLLYSTVTTWLSAKTLFFSEFILVRVLSISKSLVLFIRLIRFFFGWDLTILIDLNIVDIPRSVLIHCLKAAHNLDMHSAFLDVLLNCVLMISLIL